MPNANTMFVNRADHFGLAQLYQLRGRVGPLAPARVLLPASFPTRSIPTPSVALQVLEHHTELGAGYRIALKDLEMRGAGNLLGAEQSGFVHAVGFDLYLRMLEETVRRLMSRRCRAQAACRPTSRSTSPNYLPDDYVVSQDAKIDVYKRLARFEKPQEIEALRTELRDRFGPLPAAGRSDAGARPIADHWGRLGDRRNPGAWRRSSYYL